MDAITYEDNNKLNRDKMNESSIKINQALKKPAGCYR